MYFLLILLITLSGTSYAAELNLTMCPGIDKCPQLIGKNIYSCTPDSLIPYASPDENCYTYLSTVHLTARGPAGRHLHRSRIDPSQPIQLHHPPADDGTTYFPNKQNPESILQLDWSEDSCLLPNNSTRYLTGSSNKHFIIVGAAVIISGGLMLWHHKKNKARRDPLKTQP